MWKRTLWEALAILAIASVLGLLFNHYRTGGLELIAPERPAPAPLGGSTGMREISVEAAAAKFDSGEAVFADARSPEEFERGHIRGALNLPPAAMDAWAEKLLSEIGTEVEWVTYCDGENCPLARELAGQLNLLGFERVYYLEDGWRKWRSRGLPVDISP
jgi:rhodanese-related sulfurtransferase